jgi:ATP-dependent RNA helicase RhlE
LNTFSELGLIPELLRALKDASYEIPTPIQAQAIPVALRGGDVLGCAQTGTGKTAGFLLPTLQRLSRGKGGRLRALVLTPTRELAAQIGESAKTYGKYLSIRSTAIFGGVGIFPQTSRLRAGVDLLIATPGRLLDHMERGNVDFRALEVLVLDEADRMLDMGFLPDVRRILRALPSARQTLFFSATMPPEVERMIQETLKSPLLIQAGRRSRPVDTVRQVAFPVDATRKSDLLCHLLERGEMRQVLVFTRTKARADRLARHLVRTGRKVAAIHGNKSQNQRVQALNRFKSGKIEVLVATDIAARGLDVDGISHVINFDVPNVPEDYVHRIGRTARMEATGDAISLFSPEEGGFLRGIERLTGIAINREVVAGFEPSPGFERAEEEAPAHAGSGSGHGSGSGYGRRPSPGGRPHRPSGRAPWKPRSFHGSRRRRARR